MFTQLSRNLESFFNPYPNAHKYRCSRVDSISTNYNTSQHISKSSFILSSHFPYRIVEHTIPNMTIVLPQYNPLYLLYVNGTVFLHPPLSQYVSC